MISGKIHPMAEFYILEHPDDPGDFCFISDLPDDFPDPWMASEGERMGDDYGSPVDFRMSARSAGIALSDFISNTLGYYIVSARLRELLEEAAGVEIEFLPVRIINHKGRVASEEYSVANVIGTLDCVDMSRSEGQLDPDDETIFARLEKLYLDRERIPPDRALFRIASMPPLIVIREDLRRKLMDAEITGAVYLPLGEKVNIIA